MEYSLIETIIIGFFNFLGNALDLIPALCSDIPVLGYLLQAMDWITSLLITVSIVIPVEHIALVALAILGVNAGTTLVYFANWVIRRIADIIP